MTYRRDEDYFGVAGVAPASDLSLLADISQVESAGLPPATPERAISSYAYMTSQAWRLPEPHIQTGLLITQSVQIPRKSAVRVSKRQQ